MVELPKEFQIRLQKGIVGGFVPASPTAIITADKRDTLIPEDAIRLHVTKQLSPGPGEPLGDVHSSTPDYNQASKSIVTEIYLILKELPIGPEVAFADFYGADTGITWRDGSGFEWFNSGPEGCVRDDTAPQATPEQKEAFKKAVDLIKKVVDHNGDL
ncbi:hypothetical protein AX16_009710 [Volvariella volvacea WC 439]|nr:hypothetical protein AX16_009710 [Volvariella volvacea WC 439]